MFSDKRVGVYSLIGVILLASGLPLTLYQRSVSVQVSGLYTVSFENGYSFNLTFSLNQGDRLLLYISPLKQVNYSLTVKNSLETIVLNASQINKTLLINVNFTESHTLVIAELPPFQYTQIRFEVIRCTNASSYDYLSIGIPLTIIGLILSFTGLREIKFFRKKPLTSIRFNLNELSLLILFLLSYMFMTVFLPFFIIDVIFQNWFTIIFLIFFSVINIISVYRISIKFSSEKFNIISILLVALAYIWIPLSIILLLQSQILIFNYYNPNNIVTFNFIREFTLNYTSIYFQMILFILIPPIFYLYLSTSILSGAYLYNSADVSRPFVEETSLNLLKNNLVDLIKRKDLVEFFNLLKNISLEASVILFLVVKEYVEKNIRVFTYYKLLLNYSDLFNKKLYERKPVENILTPLGFINSSSGRFKLFKLNTELEELKFIIDQLNMLKDEKKLELIESAAGVGELRDRKIRFSGVN